MNPAALFAAHKGAVLGIAAAATAGLALMKRKSGGSAPAGGGATLPASVAADGFMGPDSSAYDVYNALLPELDALRQTGGGPGTGINTAPAVVRSPIFQGDNFHFDPKAPKNLRPLAEQSPVTPRRPWPTPTRTTAKQGRWRMA